MPTLLELTAEYQFLASKLVESNGEVTPEIESYFEELKKDVLKKANSISYVKDRFKKESEFWKEKADQMSKIKRSCDLVQTRLTDLVKHAMRSMEMWELQTEIERFCLVPMKQKLVVDNEALIPRQFFKEIVSFELDKTLLEDTIRKGFEVPGAHLEDVVALRIYPRKADDENK